MSGLRRALLGLAVAGLAAGLVVIVLGSTSTHAKQHAVNYALGIPVGWSFIGAGPYAWWRRPDHGLGPLMTLG